MMAQTSSHLVDTTRWTSDTREIIISSFSNTKIFSFTNPLLKIHIIVYTLLKLVFWGCVCVCVWRGKRRWGGEEGTEFRWWWISLSSRCSSVCVSQCSVFFYRMFSPFKKNLVGVQWVLLLFNLLIRIFQQILNEEQSMVERS